jgi:hypothetical protein
MAMQVYVITSVVNSEEKSSDYGAPGIWYEVFSNKDAAITLLKEWGCEPLPNTPDAFLAKKEFNGKMFNFYYKINTQFFAGA